MSFNESIYKQLEGQRGVGAGKSACEFFSFPKNKRVLEIGFGSGELVVELTKRGNAFYGVDIGKASHEYAIKDGFIDKGNLIWLDISFDRLPWTDDFFDFVYCTEVLEHLENPAHMFMEVKRTLKDQGLFIVSFPRPEDNLGSNSGMHSHMYPGFLLKKSFRMFCDQMYFKVVGYKENGSTAWYLLVNVKEENQVGVHTYIQGNYDSEELHKHLHTGNAWKDKQDPLYQEKMLYKLGLAIRQNPGTASGEIEDFTKDKQEEDENND